MDGNGCCCGFGCLVMLGVFGSVVLWALHLLLWVAVCAVIGAILLPLLSGLFGTRRDKK